jgi:hypothetical protein
MGGWAKFAENLRISPFNKDLSNEATFSLSHLAGYYLKNTKRFYRKFIGLTKMQNVDTDFKTVIGRKVIKKAKTYR